MLHIKLSLVQIAHVCFDLSLLIIYLVVLVDILKLKESVVVDRVCLKTNYWHKRLRPNIIDAEDLQKERLIWFQNWFVSIWHCLPFKLIPRQFPMMPAFAMTINKSQEQTLDTVGIFLPEPVFGRGQLYVAFSWVWRACDVKIKAVNTSLQGKLVKHYESVFTLNVIYREILE